MTLTIELPETVTRELSERHISSNQVRAFVVEALEAWLRLQTVETKSDAAIASALYFLERCGYAIPHAAK